MAKDMWLIRNAVDGGTLSASSAEPLLGPNHIKEPRMGRVWRPLARAAGSVTVTFTTPVQVDAIAVVTRGWKVPNSIRLAARSVVGGANDVFDGFIDGAADPVHQTSYWIPERDDPNSVIPPPDPNVDNDPPKGPTLGQIVVTVAAGIDVGRIWAGPAMWRPKVGHTTGGEQRLFDQGTVQMANRSGAVFTDHAARIRQHSVKYDMLDDNEVFGPVQELTAIAGATKQLLFLPNWEFYKPSERQGFIGYMAELNPIIALGWRRWERAFAIREAG
jgi:hypothetical protein